MRFRRVHSGLAVTVFSLISRLSPDLPAAEIEPSSPSALPGFRATVNMHDEAGRSVVRPRFNPDPGGRSDLDLQPVQPEEPAQPVAPPQVIAVPKETGETAPASPAAEPDPEDWRTFGESTVERIEPALPSRETGETSEPAGVNVLIPMSPSGFETIPDDGLFEPPSYAGQDQALIQLPGTVAPLDYHEPHLKPPEIGLGREAQGLPPNAEAKPDRWRLGFEQWKRYDDTRIESTYQKAKAATWHPYRQSLLKGDLPLLGQDIFLSMALSNQTTFEARRLPTPSGISGARPDNAEFYGRGDQLFMKSDTSVLLEVFKGETAFKPVTWALRVQGVYNINYLLAAETGVVSPDARGPIRAAGDTDLGDFSDDRDKAPTVDNQFVRNPRDVLRLLSGRISPKPGTGSRAPSDLAGVDHDNTQRGDSFFALQQAFFELHLADLSANYDFVSSRIGLQPFISDFRGFVFNETNLGVRLFGNLRNNRWQANLAAFDMREKDTNSELNTFESRHQYVFAANVYRQDTFVTGYTTQLSFLTNLDDGSTEYDTNGFIVRPAPIGRVEPHDVKAFYLGFNGEGHIGWLNISHSFYQVFGRDQLNGIAGQEVDINAQMAALELSIDKDWIRYKASVFYASGDGDSADDQANGFDSIVDNPFFFNSPFSYWARQGFNLGGTAVALKQRDSLLPNLRTNKFQGQSNFVNPGLFAIGLGMDMEITPRFRANLQVNYFRFAETDAIQRALLTDRVDAEIGYDLSLGFTYRPLLTNNIIISAGVGVLIPGKGLRDIYRTTTKPVEGYEYVDEDPGDVSGDFLYSGIIAVTLTY